MTKVFLSAFYSLLTFILFYTSYFFFLAERIPSEFIMFAKPFAPLLSHELSLPFFCILGLLNLLICIFKPHLILRLSASLLFLVLFSAKYSFGKIDHSEHIWMIFSILVCFLKTNKPLTAPRNLLVVRIMQTILLSFYFISGSWKIRDLGFSGWGEAAKEHIAFSIAEGNGPGLHVQKLLTQDYPEIIVFGFSLVILFQLSSIIPILTLKNFKLWGAGSVLFHLTTGIALGIWFSSTALAALFILILAQDLLQWDFKSSDVQIEKL